MDTWGTSNWKCGSKKMDQDTHVADQFLNEYYHAPLLVLLSTAYS